MDPSEVLQKLKDAAYTQFEPSDLPSGRIVDQPEGTPAWPQLTLTCVPDRSHQEIDSTVL